VARGQFDANGLNLSVDNSAGAITAPLLIADGRYFSLTDLPLGQSTAAATDSNLNPVGSAPINNRAVQLEADQLRGRIMEAAMRRGAMSGSIVPDIGAETSLQLAGWFTEAPPALVSVADEPIKVTRTNAMVRTRVATQPSPVGSTVKINAAFSRVVN